MMLLHHHFIRKDFRYHMRHLSDNSRFCRFAGTLLTGSLLFSSFFLTCPIYAEQAYPPSLSVIEEQTVSPEQETYGTPSGNEIASQEDVSDETAPAEADTAMQPPTPNEQVIHAEEGTISQKDSDTSVFSTAESRIQNSRKKHIIGIDPGHQSESIDMSALEPNGPNSSEMKAKCSTGTQGSYTGLNEYQLNLDVSLQLKDILEQRGYQVVLTRENNETAISNSERAQLVAAAGAEIYVRIHANGDDTHTASGALTMCPSPDNPYVPQLYEESNRLSQCILDSYCSATGFKNLGIQYTDTMTGINWSTIPVTILEMGFMTYESDDRQMSDPSFQTIMASGIADGIDSYFGTMESSDTSLDQSPVESALLKVQEEFPQANGTWACYLCDLSTDSLAAIGNVSMQSAGLISLFIMGSVYEQYDTLIQKYGSSLDTALASMITDSDDAAAVQLLDDLGNGDSLAGMAAVNQFCQNHGFESTSIGRLPGDTDNLTADNYTSVTDCGNFLKNIYQGTLAGSDRMKELLGQQKQTDKIPSLLPEDAKTANKAGELSNVKNDAAILYGTADGKDLILVFMSENLTDADAAQSFIAQESLSIYNIFHSQTN